MKTAPFSTLTLANKMRRVSMRRKLKTSSARVTTELIHLTSVSMLSLRELASLASIFSTKLPMKLLKKLRRKTPMTTKNLMAQLTIATR